jgi:hypothetical protein
MRARFASVALTLLMPMAALAGPPQHKITVTLDYDFSVNHGCKPKGPIYCVVQFNIYDLTRGKPEYLFSMLPPSGAKTLVKGITVTSDLMTLSPGVHTFGATAMMGTGTESDPKACTATVKVGSESQVSLNLVAK